MFGRRRKSECHRIREMFSPYLDDCVTSVERDAVKYHIEICDDCEWELRSLAATAQLLSRMPVASAPRSFTLTESPPRRDWVPFALPSMNRLRLATALAVVVLAILLAGDFSGVLHTDVIVVADPADPAQQRPVVTDVEDHELPVDEEMPVFVVDDPPREMPEAEKAMPPDHPPEQRAITQRIEPGEEILEAFPPVPPEFPEAILPTREPYPWLLPLQIASAALVLMLGGASLLAWQRKVKWRLK